MMTKGLCYNRQLVLTSHYNGKRSRSFHGGCRTAAALQVFSFVWEGIFDRLLPLKRGFWVHIQKKAICTQRLSFSSQHFACLFIAKPTTDLDLKYDFRMKVLTSERPFENPLL